VQSPAAQAWADQLQKNDKAMKYPVIAASLKWYLSLEQASHRERDPGAALQKQIDGGKGDLQILNTQKSDFGRMKSKNPRPINRPR